MKRTFATTVIGWFFCLAGLMMWLGWMIMPVHIGVYFEPADFAAIHEHFHLWIWMYRVHLFGYVVAGMAVVALAAVSTEPDVKALMFPGAAVAMAGLIVGALGAAFYYHHGAWGAIELSRQSFQGAAERIAALRLDTEYVTCLLRFARVFFGLGLVVLAAGLLRWGILPTVIAGTAALLGIAGMALTMALPDEMTWYVPLFHMNCLWLLTTGLTVLRRASGLEQGGLKRSTQH